MKDFIILGHASAIANKRIFPLIKDNKIKRSPKQKQKDFIQPDGLIKKIPSVWYATIKSDVEVESLELTERFDITKNPPYDNYCAFEVSNCKKIPVDDYIIIEIPDEDYLRWKDAYGDDLEIIDDES